MAEIRNPNAGGGGSENKLLLYAMLAMVVVFAASQLYRSHKTEALQKPTATASTTQQAASGAPQPVTPSSPTGSTAAFNAQAVQQTAAPVVVGSAESTVTVENQLYHIVFSTKGAAVRSWILKGQKDRYGAPLDLVNGAAAQHYGFPLSLYTYDQTLTDGLNSALFVPSATGTITAPQTLSFHYAQNGFDVTKTFHFDETYVVNSDVSVLRNGAPVRALLSWPGGFGDQEQALDYNATTLETMRDGKEQHTAFKKIVGGETLNGPLQFAGVADQYFAAVMLPETPANGTAVSFSRQIDVQKLQRNGKPSGKSADVPVPGIAVGTTEGPNRVRIFAGPKSVPVLRAVQVSGSSATLEPMLDFGFFGPIAKALFVSLYWVHDHLASNWGWAIVVLTLIINAVLIPLRIQTMKSALKMQRIQPQMDAIKARYAKYKVTDPKKADMNGEIMALAKGERRQHVGRLHPDAHPAAAALRHALHHSQGV